MWKEVGIEAWLGARKTSLEDARTTVTEIIARVQNEGDAALRDMAKKYCELTDIAVSEEEREAAYELVDVEVVESLVEAHARIERFHELQKPRDLWLQEMEPGVVLGIKTTALNRVGIYVPGGRAVRSDAQRAIGRNSFDPFGLQLAFLEARCVAQLDIC